MLSLKGDLHKETKGTPKSFERSLDEDTAILKNYEFEEYWEYFGVLLIILFIIIILII